MSDPLTRREFLGTAAAGGALLAAQLAATADRRRSGRPGQSCPRRRSTRSLPAGPGDAYLTHPTEELAKFDKYFAELEKKLGDVKFVGGDMIPPAEVDEVAAKLKDADALLIIHLSGHGGDAPVLGKLIDVGLPTALFSQPFSGHGWMYFPQWHKQGKKVVLLPTSDWGEIEKVVGLMRVPAWMKQTRILAVGGPHGTAAACSAEQVKKKLGAELVTVPNERVMEAMKAIDPKAAEAEAQEYWISQAREIVEPTPAGDHRLGADVPGRQGPDDPGEGPGHLQRPLHGQPAGLPDVQQAQRPGAGRGLRGRHRLDADDAAVRLRLPRARLHHRPGDRHGQERHGPLPLHLGHEDGRARRQAAAVPHPHADRQPRRRGPGGREPRRPAGHLRQAGQPRHDADVSRARSSRRARSPLACRTQFTQSVPDARRLFLNWGGDVIKGDVMTLLHRVVFYGDYMKPMQDLGDLMGFKVIEEGGVA